MNQLCLHMAVMHFAADSGGATSPSDLNRSLVRLPRVDGETQTIFELEPYLIPIFTQPRSPAVARRAGVTNRCGMSQTRCKPRSPANRNDCAYLRLTGNVRASRTLFSRSQADCGAQPHVYKLVIEHQLRSNCTRTALALYNVT